MSVTAALLLSRAPVAAFVVLGMYWGAFAALVPQIKARLGADDGTFGLLLLGTSGGLLTAMWLAPRVDARLLGRAMPFASLMLAAAFLLPGLATAPVAFFCAMLVVGVASGLTDVVMNARVSDLEARHGRSLMNANHAMFSVAYAISAVMTGIAREAGLPAIAVFALLAVITVLLSFRMSMEVPRRGGGDGLSLTLPQLTVLLCGLMVMVGFMAEAAVESWSALHVERTLGGSAAEGALGPAMLGFTMAIGRFSGQVVSERLRDLTVVSWAAVLSACGAVIAATAPAPAIAYLGFGILGLGISVIGPLGIALAGRLVPPHLRTDAISRVAVIGFAGFFLAPALMGFVSAGFGLRVAFGCVALTVLSVPVLASIIARR